MKGLVQDLTDTPGKYKDHWTNPLLFKVLHQDNDFIDRTLYLTYKDIQVDKIFIPETRCLIIILCISLFNYRTFSVSTWMTNETLIVPALKDAKENPYIFNIGTAHHFV